MPNTNPQAVRAANEMFRVLCDRLAQTYHYCRMLQAEIAAEGIDNLFADDKDVIVDGSAEDGRSPISNEDIKGLIAAVDNIVAFYDGTPTQRDLILRVSVNGSRF
jgi:hypothetical protein